MLKRILFIPDCHIPYHDERAWALMLKAAVTLQPEIVVILGDFADFYSVSSHDKNRGRAQFLDDEVAAVKAKLKQLRTLKPNRLVYISGNHEDRLDRYLMQKAPALLGAVKTEELFDLKAQGIEWVPYKRSFKLGKLHLTHDVGNAGKNAHRTAASSFMKSAIIGHTHRMAYEVTGRFDSVPYLSAMFGWLGDFDSIDYMHAVKAREWVHGFGVGYMESNGIVHVQPVPIVNGHCVVAGELIS
jgi:predicted phosphodiesterase